MSLSRVFKKDFNHVVGKQIGVDFNLETDALYLIKIVARARAWWQRLPPTSKDYWADEELRVAVDDTPLKIKFNGNSLWGTRQFIFLLWHLPSGSHKVSLLNKHTPFLELVEVYQVKDFSDIDFLSLAEQRPQDIFLSTFMGRSKPWVTIHSQVSAVLGVQIEARSEKNPLPLITDDEDLQIKINGERRPNKEDKSHKYWYWCGRTLKGEPKTFEESFSEENKVSLLELISDRSPSVSEFLVSFQRIPTVNDPKWTGKFADDMEAMLLARLVFGEAEDQPREAKIWVGGSVLNRVEAAAWPDTIYDVILQSGQYDPFKPEDPRYPKIIDPLKDVDHSVAGKWRESYEIARDIISQNLKNPTEATHFHGRGVTKEWFLENIVPNGRLIRQIGDTYFYWSLN